MHCKLLLRAAELVAMGWTRSVALETSWAGRSWRRIPRRSPGALNGAINRALLDVLGWDWYSCRLDLGFWMTLRRPVREVLRGRPLSTSLGLWSDLGTQQAVEDVLRAAAARLSEQSTP